MYLVYRKKQDATIVKPKEKKFDVWIKEVGKKIENMTNVEKMVASHIDAVFWGRERKLKKMK